VAVPYFSSNANGHGGPRWQRRYGSRIGGRRFVGRGQAWRTKKSKGRVFAGDPEERRDFQPAFRGMMIASNIGC